MADLNARIKPKKSSTAGEVPQAGDLEVSEIAVNTADGKLFVKHTDDSIKEISGGAVDSVNGQTGAVSLDIQDMGDYQLREVPNPATPTWSAYWDVQTLANNACMTSGKIGPGSYNGDEGVNISTEDNLGTTRSSEISALANDVLYYNKNGGDWIAVTTGPVFTGLPCGIDPTYFLACPDLKTAILAAQVGDTFGISDGVASVAYEPLADGDILTWDNTDNKFKPTALVSGPTTVDTLNDVGVRDEITPFGWNVGGSGVGTVSYNPNSGFAGPNDSFSGRVLIHKLDSSGVDRSTELSALSANDTITFAWTTPTGVDVYYTTQVASGGVAFSDPIYSVPLGNGNTQLPTSGSMTIYAAGSLDGTTAPATKADKDVVMWNDTDSEYQTTPLDAKTLRESLDVKELYSTSNIVGGELYYDSVQGRYFALDQSAAALRSILGIPEYADDTAAGSGGLTTGMLYYNTGNDRYMTKT